MRVLTREKAPALASRYRRLAALLPLASLLLAVWACGFSIGRHVGARPLPVTQRPDAELLLAIQIAGQYGDSSSANVTMQARVFEAASGNGTGNEVALADSVRVTCNGQPASRSITQSLYLQCPREPAGGSYQLTFADPHGATTTIFVPVPLGAFAFVSPHAGARVPIPTNGALAVHYTLPVPPANGSAAVDIVTASCNLTQTTPCGAVYASLQPMPTPTPGSGLPTATPDESRGPPTPTPGADAGGNAGGTPVPNNTPVPTIGPPTPTVSVTQNGQSGTAYLTGDYSTFVPAPGILSMSVEAHVAPDPGGFAGVAVTYLDSLRANITWIR